MGNEKFVIWGIGERGKIITEFLEDSQILAYIDTDISKQGKKKKSGRTSEEKRW